MDLINVKLINNDGAGIASDIHIPRGSTVGDLIKAHGNGNPESYTIKVNRLIADPSQALNDGDRISLSPNKIAGAR